MGVVDDKALQLLARRPLTETELGRRLAEQGHPAAAVAAAIARLRDSGYVDDRVLARDYILTRTERLGHGRARLLGDLERRGVAPETALEAWDQAVGNGEIDPREMLRRQVRRKLRRQAPRLDVRAFARVYNALLRAGFDSAMVRQELEPYRMEPDPPPDGPADGMNHDDLP